MAAPQEMAQLVACLAAEGYWVYAPRLNGHGTAPEDLADRSFQDWVTSVDEGYAMLANCCPRVVVGGFSTGAGLALDLAARGRDIAGVFAVCPPFVLQNGASRLAPAVNAWNQLLDRVRVSSGKMEFVENHPEHPDINYRRNPVRGVRELSRLMDGLEDRLPHIASPALVIQSLGDPVVDFRGTWRLFERLGTAEKEFFLFHFNRHGILLGEGVERVHRAVVEFVARVT
jgi:esterase/lipase